jgi:hypothetical protein
MLRSGSAWRLRGGSGVVNVLKRWHRRNFTKAVRRIARTHALRAAPKRSPAVPGLEVELVDVVLRELERSPQGDHVLQRERTLGYDVIVNLK